MMMIQTEADKKARQDQLTLFTADEIQALVGMTSTMAGDASVPLNAQAGIEVRHLIRLARTLKEYRALLARHIDPPAEGDLLLRAETRLALSPEPPPQTPAASRLVS